MKKSADDITVAENMAIIRARTRQAREALGWDTKTMAAALGVSEPAYKKYEERKSSTILTKYVKKFCRLTQVDSGWLTNCDKLSKARQVG